MLQSDSTFLEEDEADGGIMPNLKGRVIKVSDFGGYPDDGKPDQDAILAAINTADFGSTIVFAPGVYDITQTLNISKSGVTLYGQTGAVLKTSPEMGANSMHISSDHVIVRNLIFDGCGIFIDHSGRKAKNAGLVIDHDVFRLNCTKGAYRNGISFTTGLKNSSITNNFFTGHNGTYGIYGNNYDGLTMANNEFIDILGIAGR